MEKLKSSFRKNGLDYKLIDRTDFVSLFELSLDNQIVGYEVAKIYQRNDQYGHREAVPSNEQFGYDGSKAMFPSCIDRAKKYFFDFNIELQDKLIAQNAKITLI